MKAMLPAALAALILLSACSARGRRARGGRRHRHRLCGDDGTLCRIPPPGAGPATPVRCAPEPPVRLSGRERWRAVRRTHLARRQGRPGLGQGVRHPGHLPPPAHCDTVRRGAPSPAPCGARWRKRSRPRNGDGARHQRGWRRGCARACGEPRPYRLPEGGAVACPLRHPPRRRGAARPDRAGDDRRQARA